MAPRLKLETWAFPVRRILGGPCFDDEWRRATQGVVQS